MQYNTFERVKKIGASLLLVLFLSSITIQVYNGYSNNIFSDDSVNKAIEVEKIEQPNQKVGFSYEEMFEKNFENIIPNQFETQPKEKTVNNIDSSGYNLPKTGSPIVINEDNNEKPSGNKTEESLFISKNNENDYRRPENLRIKYTPNNQAKTVDQITPALSSDNQINVSQPLIGFSSSSPFYSGSTGVSVTQEFSLTFDILPSQDILNAMTFYPLSPFTKRMEGNTMIIKPERLQRDTDYIFGLQFSTLCTFGVQPCSYTENQLFYPYSFSFKTDWKEHYIYGYSWQGNPLNAYIFGNADANGKSIMLTGGLHGSEWRSGDLGQLIDYLSLRPEMLRGQNKKIVIIPFTNPDGTIRNIRDNSRGVNLNRNWPANWEPCQRCGNSPLSELETSFLHDFTLSENITHLISYHAQWPPVGIIFLGDDFKESTWNFGRWVSDRTGYPIGFFPDEDIVPGDQAVWGESVGITSIIIEASYIESSDWDKNFPMYVDLITVF